MTRSSAASRGEEQREELPDTAPGERLPPTPSTPPPSIIEGEEGEKKWEAGDAARSCATRVRGHRRGEGRRRDGGPKSNVDKIRKPTAAAPNSPCPPPRSAKGRLLQLLR